MIYAHRGIKNDYIPENSIPSFIKAKVKNIGIELDVRLIKSGEVVIFHDSNLKRMTGINKKIENSTYTEIKDLNLLNTKYKIPLLKDVLKLINSEVPLLIEIKSKNVEILTKLKSILKNYSNFKIQSFHKNIIKKSMKYYNSGLLSYDINNNYDFLSMPNYLINDLTIKDIKVPLFIWHLKINEIDKYKKYTNNFIVDYD